VASLWLLRASRLLEELGPWERLFARGYGVEAAGLEGDQVDRVGLAGIALVSAAEVDAAEPARKTQDLPEVFEVALEADEVEPELGLNFVSFQRDLEHLWQILGLPSWLGGVNFGGRHERDPGEPDPIDLITLEAGGLYAVPPREEPFPGAKLFKQP